MISKKYTLVVLALFIFALIPTISGFYQGLPILKGNLMECMPKDLPEMVEFPTERKGRSVKRRFKTEDWMEKVFTNLSGSKVTLFAARGFDGRPFFHFPERALLKSQWSERTYQAQTLNRGDISTNVHVLNLTGTAENTTVYYVLLYGEESVGNPYTFLLKKIPVMLVGKRRPFTLLFAYTSQRKRVEDGKILMESLIFSALDSLRNGECDGKGNSDS